MTARELLDALTPYRPAVEDGDLVYDDGVPPGLLAVLQPLNTGIRALLANRPWWGVCPDLSPRPFVLNPNMRLPAGVKLACAEGDAGWDRMPSAALHEMPHLFD